MNRDLLAEARSFLAASSSADLELRALYTARARNAFVAVQRETDAFAIELAGVERELVRLAKAGER